MMLSDDVGVSIESLHKQAFEVSYMICGQDFTYVLTLLSRQRT